MLSAEKDRARETVVEACYTVPHDRAAKRYSLPHSETATGGWRYPAGRTCDFPGADPGFLPGEGAKALMTLYAMGISDFWHTLTQICNFFKMFIAILCLNGVEQPFKGHQCPFFLPLRRRNPRLRRGSLRPGVSAGPSAPSHLYNTKISTDFDFFFKQKMYVQLLYEKVYKVSSC